MKGHAKDMLKDYGSELPQGIDPRLTGAITGSPAPNRLKAGVTDGGQREVIWIESVRAREREM